MGMLLRRNRGKKQEEVKPKPEPKAAPKKSGSKKKGE
jgi:hypothetical protein